MRICWGCFEFEAAGSGLLRHCCGVLNHVFSCIRRWEVACDGHLCSASIGRTGDRANIKCQLSIESDPEVECVGQNLLRDLTPIDKPFSFAKALIRSRG